MVEVFKTNVTDPLLAQIIIDIIHKTFINYKANFDLDDCDHILRIEHNIVFFKAYGLIEFLKEFEINAEVLEDNVEYFSSEALVRLP